MKRILILLSLIFVVVTSFIVISRFKERSFKDSSALEIEEEIKIKGSESNQVIYNEKPYSYLYFIVDDASKLKLIPNFTERIGTKDILSKYNCISVVSGGFYANDPNNQDKYIPTGLFIYGGNNLGVWTKNSLFDGIISINDFETPRVTRSVPQDHLRLALQTGPIIKENGMSIKLAIRNDMEERRVIAGVTGENSLVFLIIYDETQNFSGPLLSDLPEIMKNIEENEGFDLADIINLDGGTASSFITSDVGLIELTTVGSFFCLN